jgi:hypothetical protein
MSSIDIDEFNEHLDFLLESRELPSTNMDLYDEFNILQQHDFTNLNNVRTYFEKALADHENFMSDDDYGEDEVYDSLRIVVNGLQNPDQVFPIDLEDARERLMEKMVRAPTRKMNFPMVKPLRVGGTRNRKTKKTKKQNMKKSKKQRKNKNKTRKLHKYCNRK